MVLPVSPQLHSPVVTPSTSAESAVPAAPPVPATETALALRSPAPAVDVAEQLKVAKDVLGPFLQKPSYAGRHPIKNYMKVLCARQPAAGDINRVLHSKRSKSSPLERGVVGPTGGSATVNFSILGPIFGGYGTGASCKIIHKARLAERYLSELRTALKALEAELETLKTQVGTNPDLQLNVAELEQRIFALREFITAVETARNEQRFNLTFPGVIQLTASSLLCTLAVDLAPTLGGGGALFSVATLGLSVAASSVLGVYAAGSMVKSSYQLGSTLTTPRFNTHEANDAQDMVAYKKKYNKRLRAQTAFYGLNTISWGVYVAGAALLIATLAGGAALHGAPQALVVTGALAAVIWDAVWGREFSPHTTLAPHIDRNFLNNIHKRKDLWKLLSAEHTQLENTVRTVLKTLPPSRKPKPIGWKQLPREMRYKYFWQFLPATAFHGRSERLARWCVADAALVDPIIVDHMKEYTAAEIAYQETKLVERTAGVVLRILEFGKARAAGHEVNFDTLQSLLTQDGLALQRDELKLAALQELRTSLASLDVAHVHNTVDTRAAWNKLRLQYMAVHGILDNFVEKDDLMVHPDWYVYEAPHGNRFKKRFGRVVDKQLTQQGLRDLSARGFTPGQEKRFIRAVADMDSNRYETATLFGMERSAQKRLRKERKKTHLVPSENLALASNSPQPD